MTKGPDFAIVIPTYNEASNISVLISRLDRIMSGKEWEAIVVDDDSQDGTASIVRRLAEKTPRVRILQRIGRKGLSSACVEGILATSAQIIAVMDGDLQHDEAILPEMFRRLSENSGLDLVVATRHKGGDMGAFSQGRVRLSNWGKNLAAFVCHAEVSDPMSGYFALKASFFHEVVHRLSQSGFKILVDILATSRRAVNIEEVPYSFRERLAGESKLDASILSSYLFLLTEKVIGHYIPVKFALFCLVGLTGIGMHLAVLALALHANIHFQGSQFLAAISAMTWNYVLNNAVTFSAMRRKGRTLITGLLVWYAACSVGLFLNVKVATYFNSHSLVWPIASLSGLAVAATWNYGVNSVLLWNRQSRTKEQRSRREVELMRMAGHA